MALETSLQKASETSPNTYLLTNFLIELDTKEYPRLFRQPVPLPIQYIMYTQPPEHFAKKYEHLAKQYFEQTSDYMLENDPGKVIFVPSRALSRFNRINPQNISIPGLLAVVDGHHRFRFRNSRAPRDKRNLPVYAYLYLVQLPQPEISLLLEYVNQIQALYNKRPIEVSLLIKQERPFISLLR